MKLPSLFLSLLFSAAAVAAEPTPKVPVDPPQPLTYEGLKAWHQAGGLSTYSWPKEHRVDLNGDKKPEVLLGTGGYGRGMTYALFTQTAEGWTLLADDIEGSHHEPIVLEKAKDGWHDLKTQQPSGRGGLVECDYEWDGKKYIFKESQEITEKELKR